MITFVKHNQKSLRTRLEDVHKQASQPLGELCLALAKEQTSLSRSRTLQWISALRLAADELAAILGERV